MADLLAGDMCSSALEASSATTVSSGLWAVHVTTLRQRFTPNRLLGRVTSAAFTVVHTAMTLGAILGGMLAAHTSIRTTFFAGAFALACCPAAGLTRITLEAAPDAREVRVPPES